MLSQYVVHRLTSDMQFTNNTRKALFPDTYESHELKITIYDPYKYVYIGHGCIAKLYICSRKPLATDRS